MKLFRAGDINTVKSCQLYFSFNLPSVLLKKQFFSPAMCYVKCSPILRMLSLALTRRVVTD